MRWLDKLERKYGRFAISGLMTYIVGLSAVVFVMSQVQPTFVDKLYLYPALVLKGQVWRLFTYIFVPGSDSPIWIVFTLYLYYLIGTSLENEWGSFRFNVYYLLGMLGTTIVAFIAGFATATYLNLSLFLAFAYLFPNYELLIFFVVPVKVKYLGWLNWLYIGYTILIAPMPYKLAAIASVLNFVVFFGKEVLTHTNLSRKSYNNRKRFKSETPKNLTMHRCAVCGITEKDNPDMEFRYCVECDGGDYEYCMEHLKNHKHIKKVISIDRDAK